MRFVCFVIVMLLTPSVILAQAPSPNSSSVGTGGPKTEEQRLKSLEEQNEKLRAEIEEFKKLRTPALDTLTRPVVSPTPEASNLVPLSEQLSRPLSAVHELPIGEEAHAGVTVDLERGVRVRSHDGRYRFELHNLSQFDGRFFDPTGGPLVSSFVIPRQRMYFTGLVDEKFEFTSVLNRGYGSLDVLDSYAGYRVNKQMTLRVGRMKVPYSYEYFKTAEGDLIAPERSVFVGNLSPNRQIGAMLTGKVLGQTLEYAVGVFNGPQRSFSDTNSFKDPFFYMNARPFLQGDRDFFRNMNFGLAFNYGRENDILEPNGFRTANDETTTSSIDNVSPTFLRFNPTTRIIGEKAFWAADFNWYYRSLTAQLMYNGGYMNYAVNDHTVRVPYTGYTGAITYFLTGEEIIIRKEVTPLRDFDASDPIHNPGALEAYTRVSYLNAGTEIYNFGLVDPTLWSRNALVTDVGTHWYPNRYLRITFGYQHAQFGSPIQISPTKMVNSTNLYWLRTQIYF